MLLPKDAIDAIYIMNCYKKSLEDSCGNGLNADISAFDTAISCIVEMVKFQWIPCSVRLPEEGKTVIASTEYGVYPETRYTKENGWEWAYEAGADYWRDLDGVEAWMPLPEKYEEVG